MFSSFDYEMCIFMQTRLVPNVERTNWCRTPVKTSNLVCVCLFHLFWTRKPGKKKSLPAHRKINLSQNALLLGVFFPFLCYVESFPFLILLIENEGNTSVTKRYKLLVQIWCGLWTIIKSSHASSRRNVRKVILCQKIFWF